MPTQRIPRQVGLAPARTVRYRRIPVPDITTGGGGAGSPTASWNDTFGMDDFMTIIYKLNFPDTFSASEDALGVDVGLFDTLSADDRLTLAQAVANYVDTFGANDTLSLTDLFVFLTDTVGLDDSLVAVLKYYFTDTFGVDDLLAYADVSAVQPDTLAAAETSFGIVTQLFDTLAADDRLTFVDILSGMVDTVGTDDRLTLAQVAVVYIDTFGMDDDLSFADLFADQLDTVSLAESTLGLNTALFDTTACTDNLLADIESVWTESTIQYFNYKGGSAGVGEFLQIADSATVSITGDIDIAIAYIEANHSPAGFPRLVTKWGAAGQRSWNLEFDGSGTGAPIFVWTADGTNIVTTTMAADAAPGFTNGTIGAIRITLDVADGANKTLKYYKRTPTAQEIADGALTGPLSDWTQFGDTQTESGNTSIFDSTAAIAFGADQGGVNPTNKQILGCAIRNGIEGTLVVDYRAADATSVFQTVNERANSLAVTQGFGSVGGVRSHYGPAVGYNDAMSLAQILNWTCGRSGTPNSDPCGDGWIDQNAATTNHGNETPLLAKGKATVGNNERKALVKFDFTSSRYSGVTARAGGLHGFSFSVVNTDAILAVDLTVVLRRDDTSPFTESTLTWNTPVAGGPLGDAIIKSQTYNIPANTTTTIDMILSDAQLNDLLGDWGFFTFTTPNAVSPITVQISSREHATTGNRPRYRSEFRR